MHNRYDDLYSHALALEPDSNETNTDRNEINLVDPSLVIFAS